MAFRIVSLGVLFCLSIILVFVLVAVFGRIDKKVKAPGTIVPAARVTVASEITGIIDSVYVHEGDSVRQSDTLLILSSDDLHLRVEEAEQELSEAQAQLFELEKEHQTLTASRSFETPALLADLQASQRRMELARSVHERQQQLYDKNLISLEELERAELTYKVASSDYRVLSQRHAMLIERYERLIPEQRRRVRLAEKVCKLARTKLTRTVLVSPLNGVVMTRDATDLTGSRADEGEPLLQIADLSRMEFVAMVTERDIPGVRIGLPAKIHIAAFPHREYRVFEGQVIELSTVPVVTESGAAYEARLTVDEPWIHKDGELVRVMPGMTGRVEIVVEPGVRIISSLLESLRK